MDSRFQIPFIAKNEKLKIQKHKLYAVQTTEGPWFKNDLVQELFQIQTWYCLYIDFEFKNKLKGNSN